MRPLRLWVSALALGLGLGCGSGEDVLRVGTSGEYPPFTFVEAGELRGIEIDLANRFGAETGRRVELVKLPLAELIPALAERRIDVIMAGLSATPERQATVAFTEPYLQVGQMALIRSAELDLRGSQDLIDTPETRIGFRSGTTGEQFVHASIEQAELVAFATIEEGIDALRAEKIDYFVHDAPTIWRIVGGFDSSESQLTGLYRPLTDEHLAWAVAKGDTALAQELDARLASWRASGDLDLVLDSWIRVRRVRKD